MKVKHLINTGKMIIKKHSPEILMVVGIAGTITGAVIASVNSYKKLPVIKEKHDEKLEVIDIDMENEIVTEDEGKKMIRKEYASYALNIAKIYAVPVLIEGASITAILVSNGIMRKRAAGLAAALAATESAFDAYRKRVVDKYGEDIDKALFNGTSEIEVTNLDDKDAKPETVTIADPNSPSRYARYFKRYSDNGTKNSYWNDDTTHLEYWFNLEQSYLNDLFKAKGFLTLNDAYKELGLEETQAGMVVGWVFDPKEGDGDNYIQLDITKVNIPTEEFDEDDNRLTEPAYLIDFNVDGNIYDKMI